MNDQRDDMWFTTALLLVLDPASGTFVWARAGHCLPVLFRSERNACELRPEAGGPPLGVGLDHSYDEARGKLYGRDVLALYSDGMIERRHETLDIGEQRIMSALATWAATGHGIDEVLGGVVAECLEQHAPLRDDVCALVVRRSLAAANAGCAAPRDVQLSLVSR
jgi:serine phosphatase RsbU (regulator of sigma subunit)